MKSCTFMGSSHSSALHLLALRSPIGHQQKTRRFILLFFFSFVFFSLDFFSCFFFLNFFCFFFLFVFVHIYEFEIVFDSLLTERVELNSTLENTSTVESVKLVLARKLCVSIGYASRDTRYATITCLCVVLHSFT